MMYPQQTLIQFANSMIYLMLARFVLNDLPHAAGLLSGNQTSSCTRNFYHATPMSKWETYISTRGLVPSPLEWRKGEVESGTFLATEEKYAVFYAEVIFYMPLELLDTEEEQEAWIEAAESYALLQVDIPCDAVLHPDWEFALPDGSYGAYIYNEPIPAENVHFIRQLVPNLERGKSWESKIP